MSRREELGDAFSWYEPHQVWLDASGMKGSQVSLHGADLRRANLSNTDLRGAIIGEASE